MISSALITATFHRSPCSKENGPQPTTVTFPYIYRTVDRLPVIVLEKTAQCYLGHPILPGRKVFELGKGQHSCMLHSPPTFNQLKSHLTSNPHYSHVEIRKM